MTWLGKFKQKTNKYLTQVLRIFAQVRNKFGNNRKWHWEYRLGMPLGIINRKCEYFRGGGGNNRCAGYNYIHSTHLCLMHMFSDLMATSSRSSYL